MAEEDEALPYPEVEKIILSHPGMGSSPVPGMGTPNSEYADQNQNFYERTDLTPQSLQKNGREIPFNPNSPNVCQQLPEELDTWVKSIIQEYNHKQTPVRADGKNRNPLRYRNMRDFGDAFIVAIIIKDYCPKNIHFDTHNVTQTLNRLKKVENWEFLRWRVLEKLGFNLEKSTIEAIINHDVNALITFLYDLKSFLERNFDKMETGSNSSRIIVKTPVKKYIPEVIHSPRSKKKIELLPNFGVLRPKTKRALRNNETLLIRNQECIDELQARFSALQGRGDFLTKIKRSNSNVHLPNFFHCVEEIISLTPDSVRATPIQPFNSPEFSRNEKCENSPFKETNNLENSSKNVYQQTDGSKLDLRSLTPISLSSEEILLGSISDNFTPYKGEVSVKNDEIKMLERGETPVVPKKKKCCVII